MFRICLSCAGDTVPLRSVRPTPSRHPRTASSPRPAVQIVPWVGRRALSGTPPHPAPRCGLPPGTVPPQWQRALHSRRPRLSSRFVHGRPGEGSRATGGRGRRGGEKGEKKEEEEGSGTQRDVQRLWKHAETRRKVGYLYFMSASLKQTGQFSTRLCVFAEG